MKKVLLFAALLALGSVNVTYAQSAATVGTANGAQMKFKGAETHNFGEIVEREEPYEHKFEFTNTGKTALIIQTVTAGCGCTTPEWSKQPVLPGKSSVISVKYNSKGRIGPFTKEVFIKSNATAEPYTLHIKGVVKAPGK